MIAKIASPEPLAQALGRGMRFWEREARFYSAVASSITARIPRCYYNGSDPQSDRYALLLEDLGHLQASALFEGATPAPASAAVQWLARFQATWWNSPALASLDWMPTALERERGYRPIIEAAWRQTCDHLSAPGRPSRPLAWMEKMISRYGEEKWGGADRALTVVHNDFRIDNLFFDGDDVVVCEWQSAERGQGLFDLANLIGGSLPVEQRRSTERELVALYRRGLVDYGVDAPPLDEMFDLYRQQMLTILPVLALLVQVDPTDALRAEGVRQMILRYFVAADDLEVGEFVATL